MKKIVVGLSIALVVVISFFIAWNKNDNVIIIKTKGEKPSLTKMFYNHYQKKNNNNAFPQIVVSNTRAINNYQNENNNNDENKEEQPQRNRLRRR